MRQLALAGLFGVAAALGSIPQVSAQSAAKTDLFLSIKGEPEQGGFDPLLGWGEYGSPLFQSTLLVRDADLATKPDLATHWELSEDGLTWIVKIRPGVKFSDGTSLTAEDVAFTFTKAATAGGLADVAVLDRAEALDATTIRMTLKEARVTFQAAFFTLGIVPAKSYGDGYSTRPIGSGPFRMVEWRKGQQLIVEANPHYYGSKPQFEKLTFLFMEEDASFAAAQTGKLDLVVVPPPLADKVPTRMKRVVAKSVDNRGIMFPMEPAGNRKSPAGEAIGNDITSDKAIRDAVNTAIDREALVEGILLKYGRPAYGVADGMLWSEPSAAGSPKANLEAARKILAEGGWKANGNGVMVKNGKEARFDLLYFSNDQTRQLLAIAVADMLRPIGIIATPVGKSRPDVRRLMHTTPVLFGWGSHNPLEVYYLFHSKFAGNRSYNAGYYSNPTVDRYLDQAQRASALETSYPLWRKAEWDSTTGYGMKGDASWAWLVNLDHVYFVNNCLDIGKPQVAPHGHGWPITSGILNWRWTCS